jgi:hypothetical protein
LNYPRLKSKLDSVPANNILIADFSATAFVDHTVMEHLSGYVEAFEKKGGTLELVGLEAFAPSSTHPLGVQSKGNATKLRLKAAGRSLSLLGAGESPGLSTKQAKLSEFSVLNALEFQPWPSMHWDVKLEQFQYFNFRRIDLINNVLIDDLKRLYAMEVSSHSGEFIMKDSQQLACVVLEPKDVVMPIFVLDRERIFERLSQFAGVREIKLGHAKFDQRFFLKGPDTEAIHRFFSAACIEFLLKNPAFHIESNGRALLIFHKERVASVAEFKLMVNFAREWSQRFLNATSVHGE